MAWITRFEPSVFVHPRIHEYGIPRVWYINTIKYIRIGGSVEEISGKTLVFEVGESNGGWGCWLEGIWIVIGVGEIQMILDYLETFNFIITISVYSLDGFLLILFLFPQ